MARKHLGKTIDLHAGGQDLIFPHHENEIAQSECANGCTFSRYWMHNGFLNINNEKMSKSANNFFTVREIADKYGYEPIRYFMLTAGYRMPLNYTVELIESCKNSLERMYTCRDNLDFAIEHAHGTDTALVEKCEDARKSSSSHGRRPEYAGRSGCDFRSGQGHQHTVRCLRQSDAGGCRQDV